MLESSADIGPRDVLCLASGDSVANSQYLHQHGRAIQGGDVVSIGGVTCVPLCKGFCLQEEEGGTLSREQERHEL